MDDVVQSHRIDDAGESDYGDDIDGNVAVGGSRIEDTGVVGQPARKAVRPSDRVHQRIGIVDDDPIALWTICNVVPRLLPECSVMWATTSGETAVKRALATECRPDIILMNLTLHDLPGLAASRQIRMRSAKPMILIMTTGRPDDCAQAAADAGAQGVVVKTADLTMLRTAVHAIVDPAIGVYRGEGAGVAFDNVDVAHQRLRHAPTTGIATLSLRENLAVGLCVQGMTSKQIAKRMGATKATVDTILQRACRKAGAANRVDLAVRWIGTYGEPR